MMLDLIIVGAGPAGLSAAIEARRLGLERILVLEREAEAGGAARHCGHPGFGMLDLRRFTTGPRYAAALRRLAKGVDVRTGCAVTALMPGGGVRCSTPEGERDFWGRAVIVATGIRESTRAGRLVGGARPSGVFTTTTLQRYVHLEGNLPYQNPVVVGAEIVGLSALWTLRGHGARPAALIALWEEAPRASWLARRAAALFGARLLQDCSEFTIEGRERVTGVTVKRNGASERIACDSVILTGQWRPEAALLVPFETRPDGLEWGLARRPIQTADPAIFAAGNVRYAVRSSGPAALEGRMVARAVMAQLHSPR